LTLLQNKNLFMRFGVADICRSHFHLPYRNLQGNKDGRGGMWTGAVPSYLLMRCAVGRMHEVSLRRAGDERIWFARHKESGEHLLDLDDRTIDEPVPGIGYNLNKARDQMLGQRY